MDNGATLPTGSSSTPLREIAVPSGIHFGYKIYGDPGAAPSQAFDDGKFLYLQFKQGVPPPIPVTRDGKLLEYEVMAGGMVRISKVDSVVLRLGPRLAYVDREGVEIIALPASSEPRNAASLVVERPPAPKEEVRRIMLPVDDVRAAVNKIKLNPGVWRICHGQSVQNLKLARQVKESVESAFSGVKLELSDACGSSEQMWLEKL
jgi:hypothetical protein